jgi:small subunit ribosomal protein S21
LLTLTGVNESGHVDIANLHRRCKQISAPTSVTNVAAGILKIAMKVLRLGCLQEVSAFAAPREENQLQVLVRDNNVEQALRVLKRKMQREGVFREMRQRRAYEKPSERKAREKSEAIRRARKLARKQAIREGLLPAPPKKKPFERKPPLPEVKARAE